MYVYIYICICIYLFIHSFIYSFYYIPVFKIDVLWHAPFLDKAIELEEIRCFCCFCGLWRILEKLQIRERIIMCLVKWPFEKKQKTSLGVDPFDCTNLLDQPSARHRSRFNSRSSQERLGKSFKGNAFCASAAKWKTSAKFGAQKWVIDPIKLRCFWGKWCF